MVEELRTNDLCIDCHRPIGIARDLIIRSHHHYVLFIASKVIDDSQ